MNEQSLLIARAEGGSVCETPASRTFPPWIILRSESDAALAAALVADEPGAARRAWRLLSPLALRILRRFVGLRADGHDLCQEVFLRFFARITELRDRRALRGFLAGICLGVAQNELRRARIRRRIDFTLDGEPPDHPVEASDLEAREAIVRFCRILARSNVEDRAVFINRYVEKRKMADIAAICGWPLATTKRRLARATRRVGLKMKRDPALASYVERFAAMADRV